MPTLTQMEVQNRTTYNDIKVGAELVPYGKGAKLVIVLTHETDKKIIDPNAPPTPVTLKKK